MEKDFNKESSDSDNPVDFLSYINDDSDGNAKDEELYADDEQVMLMVQRESLQLAMEESKKNLCETKKAIASANLSDPSIIAGSSRDPDIIPECSIEVLAGSSRQSDIVYDDPNEALAGRNFSYEGSGKGKEAATEAVRYKKQSKTDSSCDSPGKETAKYKKKSISNISYSKSSTEDSSVKRSEEASGATDSKTLDSQSSQVKLTRNLSAVKRKGSDSNEKDLDESCTRISVISKSSGSRADDEDNFKNAKKLKFEDDEDDDEMKIRQNPTLNMMLSKKNYESYDLAEFEHHPQTDQASIDMDLMSLPSSSGLSNVRRYTSNREESSTTSGGDMSLCSETFQTSFEMVQLFLPSTDDPSNVGRYISNSEESSITSGSDMSPCPQTSGLSNVGRCLSVSEESSLPEEREDVSFSEREEQSLTSVSDLSSGERGESPL